MNQLLKISLFVLACAVHFGCRSYQFDPDNGVLVRLNLQIPNTTANPIKAGETFEKTVFIDLNRELSTRFDIDPNSLQTVFVTSFEAVFSQDRCRDLASYDVVSSFPGLLAIAERNKCDLPIADGKPAVLTFNSATTDVAFKSILQKDFVANIKNGKRIEVVFKMKALRDIPADFGIYVILKTEATFKP